MVRLLSGNNCQQQSRGKFQLKFELAQGYLCPTIVCLASVSDRLIHHVARKLEEEKKERVIPLWRSRRNLLDKLARKRFLRNTG